MSVIIVEGIDRVGKTTIAEAITERLEYNPYRTYFDTYKHDQSIFKYEDMDSNNETDKMFQLIEMTELLNGNVLFDRFHMTDFAYGVANRNYKFSEAYKNFQFLDAKLSLLDSFLVYVKPTDLQSSSAQHGSDLTMVSRLMDAAYEDSKMEKTYVTYDVLESRQSGQGAFEDFVNSIANKVCTGRLK